MRTVPRAMPSGEEAEHGGSEQNINLLGLAAKDNIKAWIVDSSDSVTETWVVATTVFLTSASIHRDNLGF